MRRRAWDSGGPKAVPSRIDGVQCSFLGLTQRVASQQHACSMQCVTGPVPSVTARDTGVTTQSVCPTCVHSPCHPPPRLGLADGQERRPGREDLHTMEGGMGHSGRGHGPAVGAYSKREGAGAGQALDSAL